MLQNFTGGYEPPNTGAAFVADTEAVALWLGTIVQDQKVPTDPESGPTTASIETIASCEAGLPFFSSTFIAEARTRGLAKIMAVFR